MGAAEGEQQAGNVATAGRFAATASGFGTGRDGLPCIALRYFFGFHFICFRYGTNLERSCAVSPFSAPLPGSKQYW